MPSIVVNQTYYLEINSTALACAAWRVIDPFVVFDDPDLRGSDRILPGATGRRALKRVRDATIYTFGFEVIGSYDVDGTVATDPARKLSQHLDYLKSHLGLASASGDGTVQAIFHRGSEASLTADVHFLGFKGGRLSPPAYYRTTFDLNVPEGWS